MDRYVHVLMGLFFLLMFLFCASQFSVHSYIPGHSTKKLIFNIGDFQAPRKVILVIIDSLRYDYIQKFPFISATLANYPEHSFLSKCKVSNPTMTTQRVESLMTGSQLFSSASIFKTFFASKISVDNIIDQLNIENKTSIVMGDDTWAKLFDFTEVLTCSNTYNVHDFDSCDGFIYEFMIQKMVQDKSFDFMVSHFLSLDHVGHSMSTVHSETMNIKIKKISAFMEKVIKRMDNNTVLFLTGDHGMRDDGNHGGSSESEVETFVFGYNKQVPFKDIKEKGSISQPDLTATLSLYLNIPFPLNNVGTPILQALPKDSFASFHLKTELYSNLFDHFKAMIQYYKAKVWISEKSFKQKLQNNEGLQQISPQLQKYIKNLQFLKYSSPKQQLNIGFLILLTIISIIIASLVLKIKKIKFQINNNIFQALLEWSNKVLISFSLFIAYFSWYLIKNLSNFYLSIIMASLFMFMLRNWKLKGQNTTTKLLSFVLYVFILCQIEPEKTNQYSSNFLKIDLLHKLVTNIYFQSLLMIILTWKLFKEIQSKKKMLNKWLIYFLLLLDLLNFVLSYCFNYRPYQLRAIIFITTFIGYFILDSRTAQNSYLKILILNIMLVLLGQNGPLIIWLCLMISRLNLPPLFLGFLGQMMWWFLGNRFQYSGVDVVKSYIFSSEYHPLLNGMCLLTILVAPHLILFSLYKIEQPQCLLDQKYSKTEQAEERQEFHKKQSQSQNQLTQKVVPEMLEISSCSTFQFIIVLLLSLLSSAWNVNHNNSKILFTIVYIPMLTFCLTKVILIYSMIALSQLLNKISLFRLVRDKSHK